MNDNPVLACMARHRTVRRFETRPVADRDVRRAVEAAQMAATSSNVQAYALLRIRDAERRARLVELTGGQPQVGAAGAFFVVCGDQRRHRLLAEREERPFEPNFESFLLAVIDASLFAQNLALAFESTGFGICYIGGLRNRLPEVDELLGLPDDVFPLFGLCVGYPAQDPGQRPRLPLDAVLFEEEYPSDEALLERIAAYDRTMAAYYAARGKPGYDWSGGISRKFARPNRAHLLAYYERKGARFR